MILYVDNYINGKRFLEDSPPTIVADALLGQGNSFSTRHIVFTNPVGLLERAMAGETIEFDNGPLGKESILRHMFSWRDTVQGHDFWAEIDRDLENGGEMPEKAMSLLRPIWRAAQPKEVLPLKDIL